MTIKFKNGGLFFRMTGMGSAGSKGARSEGLCLNQIRRGYPGLRQLSVSLFEAGFSPLRDGGRISSAKAGGAKTVVLSGQQPHVLYTEIAQ